LLGASSPTTSPISSALSPQAQRESPVLQYWHGRTPTKIGRHLDRTLATAAGPLKRGLKNLRQELQAERRANQTFPPGGPLRTTHRLLSATLLCSALCAFAAAAEPDPPKDNKPTNRLARATSPYLLQHAHNPVDWYPWGEEAFAKAKKEGKLVFLSVGYSSCHWCHVMERESFSNEEIVPSTKFWHRCSGK
jgi:hypothetical protein